MLSSVRNPLSRFAFSACAFALLALTTIGCGTPEPVDCAYLPSKCPGVSFSRLCPNGGGTCTVDAAPATCDESTCTLGPNQKLTIPLDGLMITGSTPDLLLRFRDAFVPAKDVHVLIDGTEVEAVEDETTSPYLRVSWTSAATEPKKIEISFTTATGPERVDVSFSAVDCKLNELSNCHSGGA